MCEIVPLNLRDVLEVCENMRQQDWEEVLNLLPLGVTKPEVVAMICMNASSMGFVAKLDGRPVGVIQIAQILHGSYRFGLFGTDRLPEVALPLAGEMMQAIEHLVDREGAVYGEAMADAFHLEAHRLLAFLGFRKTAILPGYGSLGADIALFTFTKGTFDVLRNGRWRRILDACRRANLTAGNRSD